MAAANHMPQLKKYCSWMFKKDDWEVAHLYKLIEKEYKNQGIPKPHNTDARAWFNMFYNSPAQFKPFVTRVNFGS